MANLIKKLISHGLSTYTCTYAASLSTTVRYSSRYHLSPAYWWGADVSIVIFIDLSHVLYRRLGREKKARLIVVFKQELRGLGHRVRD